MKKRTWLVAVALIVGLAGLAYLPLVAHFGYTFDDWYLMWAAKAYGPQAFQAIYSIDRPLRADVMMPVYQLFGENPLWYNLSAWAFRVLAGLAFWWCLQMLWPRQKRENFTATLFFVLYPGFLSQFNGIDYQAQMISLMAAMLSIALTVRALLAKHGWAKISLIIPAILLGWFYLGLVEYEIGFEFLRMVFIFLLLTRQEAHFATKLRQMLFTWLPYSLIPGIFAFWRIFIFQSERKATDVGVQLGTAALSPLRAAFSWAVQVAQDTVDVFISAWVLPLYQLWSNVRVWGLLLAICLTGFTVLFVFRFFAANENYERIRPFREMLFAGGLAAVLGLIPIAIVNREVAFPYFSRYSLVSSAGVAVVLGGLVFSLRKNWLKGLFLGLLLFSALLTHSANAVEIQRQSDSTNNFWWQVAWRVPQLEQNTTLVANYPLVAIQEDYFVWGPANLIYYPGKMNEKDLQPGVFAAIPTDETVQKILARERQQYDKRRNIITYANFRNILLLIQNDEAECVRVIDGTLPETSRSDSESFKQMAPFSEIEHVLTAFPQPTPPAIVFGPEPEHGWCYYYQKATLARQKGDWAEVRRLGDEASQKGLFVTDHAVEWLPFIQAYASAGDTTKLAEISSHFRESLFDEVECRGLANPQLTPEIQQKLKVTFCQKVP